MPPCSAGVTLVSGGEALAVGGTIALRPSASDTLSQSGRILRRSSASGHRLTSDTTDVALPRFTCPGSPGRVGAGTFTEFRRLNLQFCNQPETEFCFSLELFSP